MKYNIEQLNEKIQFIKDNTSQKLNENDRKILEIASLEEEVRKDNFIDVYITENFNNCEVNNEVSVNNTNILDIGCGDDNYKITFELGIKKPNYNVIMFDDCDSGFRYRYIIDTVVYNYSTDKIKLKWHKNDLTLLYELINIEFNNMSYTIDDLYKPIFYYNGVYYDKLSEPLIRELCNNTCLEAEFILNIPIGMARSQILVFKSYDNHTDWLEDYFVVKHDYLVS